MLQMDRFINLQNYSLTPTHPSFQFLIPSKDFYKMYSNDRMMSRILTSSRTDVLCESFRDGLRLKVYTRVLCSQPTKLLWTPHIEYGFLYLYNTDKTVNVNAWHPVHTEMFSLFRDQCPTTVAMPVQASATSVSKLK